MDIKIRDQTALVSFQNISELDKEKVTNGGLCPVFAEFDLEQWYLNRPDLIAGALRHAKYSKAFIRLVRDCVKAGARRISFGANQEPDPERPVFDW